MHVRAANVNAAHEGRHCRYKIWSKWLAGWGPCAKRSVLEIWANEMGTWSMIDHASITGCSQASRRSLCAMNLTRATMSLWYCQLRIIIIIIVIDSVALHRVRSKLENNSRNFGIVVDWCVAVWNQFGLGVAPLTQTLSSNVRCSTIICSIVNHFAVRFRMLIIYYQFMCPQTRRHSC